MKMNYDTKKIVILSNLKDKEYKYYGNPKIKFNLARLQIPHLIINEFNNKTNKYCSF